MDTVTNINMSEEDYIEMCAEMAREEARRDLKDKRFVKSFDYVLEDTRFHSMTYEAWQSCLKEMGYDGPEMPFKPGDKVKLVNQSDADMDGRKAVVLRAYHNKRTNKIDVEIRFDDEQDATYMYNDYDLEKEE